MTLADNDEQELVSGQPDPRPVRRPRFWLILDLQISVEPTPPQLDSP